MKFFLCVTILICTAKFSQSAGPLFAPYYDTFLEGRHNLTEIYAKTGQKSYHLAFALAFGSECIPSWGSEYAIDDPVVMDSIKYLQSLGGEMIVATGGARGPYLEMTCKTVNELANAYKITLDTVGTNHLDIDVEAPIDIDFTNKALAQLQSERPETTVSFTLMVQSDDYGLIPSLGVELLKNAKANGVKVSIVNAMLMEFWSLGSDWGQAVIDASNMAIGQMKEIWPEKSEAEIKKMYGATPMIGRNMNERIFGLEEARALIDWANENHIGLVSFWSSGRDNSNPGCEIGVVSPYCSGIVQPEFEFTKIFQGIRE